MLADDGYKILLFFFLAGKEIKKKTNGVGCFEIIAVEREKSEVGSTLTDHFPRVEKKKVAQGIFLTEGIVK